MGGGGVWEFEVEEEEEGADKATGIPEMKSVHGEGGSLGIIRIILSLNEAQEPTLRAVSAPHPHRPLSSLANWAPGQDCGICSFCQDCYPLGNL